MSSTVTPMKKVRVTQPANKRVTTKKRTVKRMSKAPLRRAIRNELVAMAEKKIWVDYAANQPITTAAGTFPTSRNLTPLLNQGTSNSQRVGNEVQCVNGYIRGYVNILPYNAISNALSTPILVKLWLCWYRQRNSYIISDTDAATSFFDVNGGVVGFQGNTLDLLLPVNKDNWGILEEKEFKLGATYASATGAVGTGGYYDMSNMSNYFMFDITKYLGKLLYDDTTNIAKNRNLFLIFQAVNADGGPSGTNVSAEYHTTTVVEYVDV